MNKLKNIALGLVCITFFVCACIVNFYVCGILAAILFSEMEDGLFIIYILSIPLIASTLETLLIRKRLLKKKFPPVETKCRTCTPPSAPKIVSTAVAGYTAAEEYQAIRNSEREWFETHYDFSTIESIKAIPEQKDLPRPPGNSPTGDVYYYLRYKARLYEKSGNIDLAIACMNKSISLMRIRYGEWYGQDESQMLVNMLVRNGRIEEAKSEQAKLSTHYTNSLDRMRLQHFQAVCRQAADLNTDLLIMHVCGSTCPECARYQGRVYSLSGNSKLFPALPSFIKKTGVVHSGCHHMFSPYIHNVTNSNMAYTLQVHPLINPHYGKDIITFSNRPFVDDRTEECKQAAEEAIERRRIKKHNKQRCDEIILESYQKKQDDYNDYDWLKSHFPDYCPASPTGYRRMKTQNTKNYQKLKQLAAQLGKEI